VVTRAGRASIDRVLPMPSRASTFTVWRHHSRPISRSTVKIHFYEPVNYRMSSGTFWLDFSDAAQNEPVG
jgi:hypothetical protein